MITQLDLETRSDLPVDAGGRYAENCDILLMAICEDDGPIYLWDHRQPDSPESKMAVEMLRRGTSFWAFNNSFEILVLKYQCLRTFGFSPPPICQWNCIMYLCNRVQIATGLGKAAEFLGLKVKKMKEGKSLIDMFCGPNILPGADDTHWEMFREYCKVDVEVQRDIFNELKCVSPTGWVRDWHVTEMEMNDRGVPVNVEALRLADALRIKYAGTSGDEFYTLVGLRPTQRNKIIDWMAERGVHTKTLDVDAVNAILLRDDIPSQVRTALEVRKAAMLRAIDKVPALLLRANSDGCVRGMTVPHGTLTGRPTGRGPQPLNMKKPTGIYAPLKHEDRGSDLRTELSAHLPESKVYPGMSDHMISALMRGDSEAIEFMGDPLELISNGIRHFIQHPTENLLDADWSSVEAMLAAYIAGCGTLLKRFESGEDVYMATACEALNEKPSKAIRNLGKVQVLACQYGIGARGLKATAANWGIKLPSEVAEALVSGYRSQYPEMRATWNGMGDAAIATVKGTSTPYGMVKFRKGRVGSRSSLQMGLPSGRSIIYLSPSLRFKSIDVAMRSREFFDSPDGVPITLDPKIIRGYEVNKQGKRLPQYGFDSSGRAVNGFDEEGNPTNSWESESLCYIKTDDNGFPSRTFTYGAKLFENAVQGTTACIMGQALTRVKSKYDVFLSVYDQVLAVKGEGQDAQEFADDLSLCPSWLPGFPLRGVGTECRYYTKD